MTWAQLGQLLQEPIVRQDLTVAEYHALPTQKATNDPDDPTVTKGSIKTQGDWLISTPTSDGKKKNISIAEGQRNILTLDLDDCPPDFYQSYVIDRDHWLNTYVAYVYNSISDTEKTRKIRVILQLDQLIDNYKFQALCRIIAKELDPDMKLVDGVSFRPAQLMYLPHYLSDQTQLFFETGSEPVNVDYFLDEFEGDWTKPDEWPRVNDKDRPSVQSMFPEDPTEKDGLVGAFCREYTILEAIAEFLLDIYEDCTTETGLPRFRHHNASGADAMVVYGDHWCHSHHGQSDPAEGQNNAFDLVRKNLFGHLDADADLAGRGIGHYPSQTAMFEWIEEHLPHVVQNRIEFDAEHEKANDDFSDLEDYFEDYTSDTDPEEPQDVVVDDEGDPEVSDDDFDDESGSEDEEEEEFTLKKLKLYVGDDFDKLKAKPYVIKSLIAKRDLGCIIGDPGAGKSVIAPYLAWSVATGSPAFGMRTRTGPVLYLAAEAEHNMGERIKAVRKELGATGNLLMLGGISNLGEKNNDDRADIKKVIKKFRPILIIIDTINVAFPGIEENSAEGIGVVIDTMKSFARGGAAIFGIHHPPKGGGMTPRGHSSLNGALDVNLYLHPENEKGVIHGQLTKNRNGRQDLALSFMIQSAELGDDEDGDLVTAPYGIEVIETTSEFKRAKLTPAEKPFWDLFVKMNKEYQEEGVPFDELRTASANLPHMLEAHPVRTKRQSLARSFLSKIVSKNYIIRDQESQRFVLKNLGSVEMVDDDDFEDLSEDEDPIDSLL